MGGSCSINCLSASSKTDAKKPKRFFSRLFKKKPKVGLGSAKQDLFDLATRAGDHFRCEAVDEVVDGIFEIPPTATPCEYRYDADGDGIVGGVYNVPSAPITQMIRQGEDDGIVGGVYSVPLATITQMIRQEEDDGIIEVFDGIFDVPPTPTPCEYRCAADGDGNVGGVYNVPSATITQMIRQEEDDDILGGVYNVPSASITRMILQEEDDDIFEVLDGIFDVPPTPNPYEYRLLAI